MFTRNLILLRLILWVIFTLNSLWVYSMDLSLRYTQKSVLSTGVWKKIKISENGIYRISYKDLKDMGFSAPEKVALCGYGGWSLDEDFSRSYIDDLPVVPVYRMDDSFLFYGNGTIQWEYKNNQFEHTNNPYSEYGYYFLTDAVEPAQMKESLLKEIASERITVFDDYILHEKDQVSVNASGRQLFGDQFTGSNKTITINNLNGITDDHPKITCRLISKVSNLNNKLTVTVNNQSVTQETFLTSTNIHVSATELLFTTTLEQQIKDNLIIRFDYSETNPVNTYIDYIRLHYKRQLKSYDEPFTFFRSIYSTDRESRFVISNVHSNHIVLNITDRNNPFVVKTKIENAQMWFTIEKHEKLQEYVLIDKSKILSDIKSMEVKLVENQNLHGNEQVDMVIISPPAFMNEAKRLAEAHQLNDGLKVLVVKPDHIYNEFSSGTPDATAYRRFMKMFYDRSKQISRPPQYLLLFGDGSYDNRFKTQKWSSIPKDNFLLTYQTENSINFHSYVVDDYFGFLDDDGALLEACKLRLGIGRFPVRTNSEAKNAVDKVIKYMNNPYGQWRNRISFVADDGNTADKFDPIHMENAENLAQIVETNRPQLMISKIYMDAYKKDYSSSTPLLAITKTIQENLTKGLFLIDYVGHGNTSSWSDEKILTQNDIKQWNYENLPIWITATCDFCRFDDVTTSVGEDVFLHPKGGGIALFTTTRVAYTATNHAINKSFLNEIFSKDYTPDITLGDVYMKAKNKLLNNIEYLGFCLMGDPALKIYEPEYKAGLSAINNSNTQDGDMIQISAIQNISLEGYINNSSGQTDPNFNGKVYLTMYDNKDNYETLGNNTVTIKGKEVVRKIQYEDYKNILYSGTANVINGKFTFNLMIPKDIQYIAKNNGKISMYAYDDKKEKSAEGFFTGYQVSGTSNEDYVDTDGPEIRAIYLNDTTFKEGDMVNTTPYFISKIWDKSGINRSGTSLGHDITLMLDNNPAKMYNLNNYYESSDDREGEGIVQFSIPELDEGDHTAEFIVWDILNNSTKASFSFKVDRSVKPVLYDIVATPNPARNQVEFLLSHNRPETTIEIKIEVFDFSGKLIWSTKQIGSNQNFKDYIVSWDLRTESGSKIKPGIYLYRGIIKTKKSKEATKSNKIIILRQ